MSGPNPPRPPVHRHKLVDRVREYARRVKAQQKLTKREKK